MHLFSFGAISIQMEPRYQRTQLLYEKDFKTFTKLDLIGVQVKLLEFWSPLLIYRTCSLDDVVLLLNKQRTTFLIRPDALFVMSLT